MPSWRKAGEHVVSVCQSRDEQKKPSVSQSIRLWILQRRMNCLSFYPFSPMDIVQLRNHDRSCYLNRGAIVFLLLRLHTCWAILGHERSPCTGCSCIYDWIDFIWSISPRYCTLYVISTNTSLFSHWIISRSISSPVDLFWIINKKKTGLEKP
jgi:hypothetical protein